MSTSFLTIEEEYSRKSKLKKEDVGAIRTWMDKEQHLPKITDLDIALFLNACYFKLEATKTCIENYYSLRTHCPEFFTKRNPFSPEAQLALHSVSIFELSKPNQKNHMVVLIKLADNNPECFVLNDVLKRIDLMVTVIGRRKGLQDGHILVFDSTGLQLGHIFKLNVVTLRKYLYFVQEAMPIRLKSIHIFNVSGLTERFLNVVKPFLKKQIADMIHMHKNVKAFTEYVPTDILPSDYGGQDESTTQNLHAESVKIIEDNAEFLMQDEKLRSDESKRLGKATNFDNIFGVEGSFKKLQLD